MAVYSYTATDLKAAVVNGTITADTPRQAREQLRQRGLLVQQISDEKPSKKRALLRRGGRRHAHKTVLFIRELSTLLSVGVPLLEALETIAKQHQGPFQSTILLLRDRVAAGIGLAQAMKEQPEIFDEMAINMTETGEDAGTLEMTLERLADFRERWAQLKGKAVTALIYPGIIAVLAMSVMVFLMTFVVPRILEPLLEQGQELPMATVIVKSVSDLLLGWWWALLLGAMAFVAGMRALLSSEKGRYAWHRWQLRIPLLGELIVKQNIARIAVVMSTLLKSGIVFLRAIQIAQRSTPNLILRDALVRCEKAVQAGEEIADALEQTSAFPPLVVQIFAVGQQSGRLEEMLDRLASDYDTQVATAAQRLASFIEPALIVMVALVVLVIVMATLLPILQASNIVA